ncbi:MAG: Uncharacterised protein [Methanobacteriota archaeon]|nr:MAG: Uncharacterised protein [Euryarchaeota archaeon]
MKPVWLTVDTDDIRHLPIEQGHPTRSKGVSHSGCSEQLLTAMENFSSWVDNNHVTLTIFVIADQLEDDLFRNWLKGLLLKHPQITVGCHGLTHRSWSAWPEDSDSFLAAIVEADIRLHDFAGDQWRPWFRAPAGYIAPWMAPVIAKAGFELDSSVNRSWLTRKKSGPWKDWNAVTKALKDAGLDSKPWLTKWGLPTCGPALSIPFLAWNARRAWSKLGPAVGPEDAEDTVYWHLLDHNRKNGKWKPPLTLA